MQAFRSLAVFFLVVVLVGCGGPAEPSGGEDDRAGLDVVATTTIWGDLVANIIGDDGDVVVLTPVGVDPHDFQPSAAQVAAINAADLVVANGLALEEGLVDVLRAATDDGANVVEVAPLLDPIPFSNDEDADSLDPHVWLDPVRMASAARLIAAELALLDPSVDWAARADEYAADLVAADATIAATLAEIPEPERKLVTDHDSLGYFAQRYGFEVIGTVIPSGSTLANPSSEELAALVELMRAESVEVIFVDTTQPDALARAVTAELGADVSVVQLHTGSLGEQGTEAQSLIGMLEANAELIADALGG